jgi:hypothetical protein
MNITSNTKLVWVLFIGLFTYLFLRALYVPFVSDECGTFFFFTQNGKFIPPDVHWDANNHILNSALSYLSYLLFGSSPLALRLPNLLAFTLFFYYVIRLSGYLKNTWIKWTFILSLLFAHNFIEFFALDRGYGMSMALIMAAIYYLFRVVKQHKLSAYFATSLFSTLALLSNLTLLNTTLLIVGIQLLSLYFNRHQTSKEHRIKALAIITGITLMPMGFLIRLLLEYKERGLLYYGTLDGFWELSVNSLIKLLTESSSILIPIAIIGYFIYLSIDFSKQVIKNKSLRFFTRSEYFFAVLFFGNLIAVFILGYILGINFPEDRTGLYFFPFFVASILFSFDQLPASFFKKAGVIILLPFAFFPIHFLLNMNVSHSTLWIDEKIPPRYYDYIAAEEEKSERSMTIGGYRMRILTWGYINFRNGGSLNQIQGSHHPEYISDFQIVKNKEDEDWDDYYTELDYDPNSELSLLKRNKFVETEVIIEGKLDEKKESSKKYQNIYIGDLDSIEGSSLLIDVKFKIESTTSPLVMWVVADLRDENKEKLAYEFISLEWKQKEWTKENGNFSNNLILYDVPVNKAKLTLYLWNVKKVDYTLSDLTYSISKIID